MKLFFMHVPRTAGSSLRRYLERSMREMGHSVSTRTKDGVWSETSESYPSYQEFVGEGGEMHREADLVCGHLPYHVVELLPPETRVVMVLRDPLARCVSHIKHQIAYEQRLESGRGAKDVNEFVASPRNLYFLRTLANLCVKYLSFRGNPNEIVKEKDLSLELALEHCANCHFGFADELAEFQQRLDRDCFGQRPSELPVQFENHSEDSFTVEDLDPRCRERLLRLNRLDLDLTRKMRARLASRSEG